MRSTVPFATSGLPLTSQEPISAARSMVAAGADVEPDAVAVGEVGPVPSDDDPQPRRLSAGAATSTVRDAAGRACGPLRRGLQALGHRGRGCLVLRRDEAHTGSA